MRYLSIILTIALVLSVSGCKGEFSSDQNGNAIPTSQFKSQVFCSKFIRINMNVAHGTVQSIGEYTQRADVGQHINSSDFIGEMTYRLREYQDGSRDIQCVLNDGSHQYTGFSSVSARSAPYSDNLCSVMYDLENNNTGGTFYFYWSNVDRGVTYVDDYQGYDKQLRVSSSECSEL